MRLFTALCCLFFISCSGSSESSLGQGAEGNWLILYADHSLFDAKQAEKYAPLQDSIVDLYGLKLMQLLPGGVFVEMDSLHAPPARWDIFQDKRLLIAEGGKGFELFVGDFISMKNDKLKLLQKVVVGRDTLPLTWAWKKVRDEEPASVLFDSTHNSWRQKSMVAENDAALKKRLAGMLKYFAIYFDYISAEAIYFMPRRVPLPFNYYAHAVGLKNAGKIDKFKKYFYSEADAMSAYNILKTTMGNVKEKFPEKDNFVEEYAAYFLQMQKALETPE